jgi:putative hydrolase of the HAD superfamily
MNGPVKALILDFGGVISKTLFETHAQTERALNLPPGTLKWRGPFDPATDELWQAMQNNELSERDYWLTRTRQVASLIGKDWHSIQQFVRAARGAEPSLVIRPEALAAIDLCHANDKKVAILSNELDLFYGEDFRQRLPFMSKFDVISDATYTNILKPDPRAYQDCLGQLDLTAQECVFVDDQPKNVAGARAINLTTVAFDVRDPAGSYTMALELLGLS